jgi:dihydrofolate reductase
VSAEWGDTTIVSGDLTDAVIRLKREHSSAYLLAQGGARFARSLVQSGLIDEYRLVVLPVILGAGEPLFTAPLTVEPVSTTVFSSGAVAQVFATQP